MLKEKSRWFSLKMIYWAGDWLDHTCRQWDGDWKTSCQTLLTSASSRWRSSNWGLVANINFQARNKYGWSQASKMFSFQTLSHTYTSEYVGVLCVVPPIFIVSISTVWSQTLNDFLLAPGFSPHLYPPCARCARFPFQTVNVFCPAGAATQGIHFASSSSSSLHGASLLLLLLSLYWLVTSNVATIVQTCHVIIKAFY